MRLRSRKRTGQCTRSSCSHPNTIIKQHPAIEKMKHIMRKSFLLVFGVTLLAACQQHKIVTDASGVFESDEVIVSAEQSGQILSFTIQEGDTLARGAVAGDID